MGHEVCGIISAVGGGVPESRLGQTVVLEPNIACTVCEQCRRGRTSACTARLSVGMNRPGGLAEKLVVPSEYAWQAPALSITDLVCTEPYAVAETALRRLARPLGPAAVVVGAGPQGLLMSLALQERGVRVSILDVNEDRLAFADKLGISSLVDPDLTVDLVVDTVGSPDANESAVGHAAVGATVLVLGLDDRPFGLSARALVRRQLDVRGSLTYDHPLDFERTLARIAAGGVRPGRVLNRAFPLEDAQAAFEAGPTAPGKTWIVIDPAVVAAG
jgi:alcohol dehydrogenase/L-iditol 2-dehydrogenase